MRTCKYCGELFPSRHGDRNRSGRRDYCGPQCFPINTRPARNARRRRAESRLRRALSGSARTPMFVMGSCRVCDEPFVHVLTTRPHRPGVKPIRPLMLCSADCRAHHFRQIRIADKKYRRAMERAAIRLGEPVPPTAIYSRDDWICQICNDPVNRQARHPDPMSVSLDHIIPLAKGGTHTYDNLQCAHLVCNIRKSDKVEGRKRWPEKDSLRGLTTSRPSRVPEKIA
jgi:5-methylcytosine-specific restriction endonuclease McrA